MVQNPPTTVRSEGKSQRLVEVTERLGACLGSISGNEVSLVQQDTDVAPDIRYVT